MSTLKQLSIALGLLTSDPVPLGDTDGWASYVWRVRAIDNCQLVQTSFCSLVEDRWDWKREQYYAFAARTDPVANEITARLTLDNKDHSDSDQVCIVAQFFDAQGNLMAVKFSNWRSLAGRAYTRDMPLRPEKRLHGVSSVAVGSKQCDVRAVNDAANFARLRMVLRQR